MYPILIDIGQYSISSWHFFYLVGSIAAWIYLHARRNEVAPQVDPREIDRLFTIAYIFGYFGARILSLYLEHENVKPGFTWWGALFELGSMTLYGDILLATAIVLAYCVWRKLPLLNLINLMAPAGLIAIGFGRIGCFLNGDDFGLPLSRQIDIPWWAIKIPVLEDNIYRYPVQLLETSLCWSLAVLASLPNIGRPPWRICISDICIYGYAIGRFTLEFLRDDFRGLLWSNLFSPAQWISIFVILIWALSRATFLQRIAQSSRNQSSAV